MSQWPDIAEGDGYTENDNKNEPGNDLWESRQGIDIESCKAVCNNNSKCKSIAHSKSNSVCWLKTTNGTNLQNDSNQKFYVKNGEPVNDQRIFYTKPITPINSWLPDMFSRSGQNCDQPQGGKPVQVGTDVRDQKSCSWVPFAKNMCPNIGDFRYFRHSQAISSNVEDYSYFDNYKNRFGNPGSQLSQNQNAPIICGYNRIPQSNWQNLNTYFDTNTAQKIVEDHCFGPGITSKELSNDKTCEQYLRTYNGSLNKYNTNIISKLRTETNWWNDTVNCTNFATIVTNNTGNTDVMNAARDVITNLPNTNWSNDLVKALNQIRGTASASTLFDAIDNKIVDYCNASSGDTNSKCGCRNAVKYGLQNCTNSITGCADVKLYADIFNEIDRYNSAFGVTLRKVYKPNSESNACLETKNSNSTILRYGTVDGSSVQVTGCFQQILNQGGNITADKIKQTCQISESSGGGSSPSAGGGGSSNNISKTIFGDDTKIKDSSVYLAIFCSLIIVIVFIVLALFII